MSTGTRKNGATASDAAATDITAALRTELSALVAGFCTQAGALAIQIAQQRIARTVGAPTATRRRQARQASKPPTKAISKSRVPRSMSRSEAHAAALQVITAVVTDAGLLRSEFTSRLRARNVNVDAVLPTLLCDGLVVHGDGPTPRLFAGDPNNAALTTKAKHDARVRRLVTHLRKCVAAAPHVRK